VPRSTSSPRGYNRDKDLQAEYAALLDRFRPGG
jgi:hypothetical protein